MPKPSVLFLNRIYPPQKGATGRLLQDLAKSFAAEGWDVAILASAPKSGDSHDGQVAIRWIKASGEKRFLEYALVWFRLWRTARKMPRHDLIVTMTDPPLLVWAGQMIAQAMNSRHIHWCQDLYPDLLPVLGLHYPNFFMNFLRARSRRAMKSCDRVIAIGRCMGKYLAKTGGDQTKLLIIPNWPDTHVKSEDESTASASLSKPRAALSGKALLIDPNPKFRVLYAGTLGRAHPAETILQAAGILQGEHPEIEFVFVGAGEGHEKLASERARLGLENMRFLPLQPAVYLKDMLESGDIHIISLDPKALGLMVPSKVYGAFLAKRPSIFIGPDACEAARLIREYQAGTVIAQGKGEELAEAIRAYRLNGDQWFRAHQGATRAAQDHLPTAMIRTWIKQAHEVIR